MPRSGIPRLCEWSGVIPERLAGRGLVERGEFDDVTLEPWPTFDLRLPTIRLVAFLKDRRSRNGVADALIPTRPRRHIPVRRCDRFDMTVGRDWWLVIVPS
jgi:hypothetical protein